MRARPSNSKQPLLPSFEGKVPRDRARPKYRAREKGLGYENKIANYHETRPRHTGVRLRILEWLQSVGSVGATRHDIAAALGIGLSTVCGRVNELIELRDVVELDERRPTCGGGTGVVVRAR